MVTRAQICDRCESRAGEVHLLVDLAAPNGAKVGKLEYWFCRPCWRARGERSAPCATHRCGGAAVRSLPVATCHGTVRRYGYCLECARDLGRAIGWSHEYWPQK